MKKILVIVFAGIWLALLISRPVLANNVKIKDIVVTNSSSELLLYLKVVNAFTPDIVNGIENGLPATFTFQVNLFKVRTGWFDRVVYSEEIDHTIVYDNLKKEYTVILEEKAGKKLTTSYPAEAQDMMSELNGLKIVPLDQLKPDQHYNLEVKATLVKKSLPFNFQYLIPFSDFWDFQTDLYSVGFRY